MVIRLDSLSIIHDNDPWHHVWDKGLSPINIAVLQKLLSCHPSDLAKQLFGGLSKGFRLQYTGPKRLMLSRNLVSAEQFKNITYEKLLKEI
jgi:hypothetical protein